MSDDVAADLDEWLQVGILEVDDEIEPVELVDQVHADRLLRRLVGIGERAVEIETHADREMAAIKAWRDDRLAGLERAEQWIKRSLDGWMRANEQAGGPRTVKLPHGDLRLRPPRPRVVDATDAVDLPLEKAVAEWERNGVLRVVRSLDKSAAQARLAVGPELGPFAERESAHAAVNADGEVVPGVVFVVAVDDLFSVTVAPPAAP